MTDPASEVHEDVAAIDREIAATMDFDTLLTLMVKRHLLTGSTSPAARESPGAILVSGPRSPT